MQRKVKKHKQCACVCVEKGKDLVKTLDFMYILNAIFGCALQHRSWVLDTSRDLTSRAYARDGCIARAASPRSAAARSAPSRSKRSPCALRMFAALG